MKNLKALNKLYACYDKHILKTSFSIDESDYFLTRFLSENFLNRILDKN